MIPNAGLRGTGDCFRSESSPSSCAGSSWGFQANSRRHKRSRMVLILKLILKWDFQETSSILHFLLPALLENRSLQPIDQNHKQAIPLDKFTMHAMELFLLDEKEVGFDERKVLKKVLKKALKKVLKWKSAQRSTQKSAQKSAQIKKCSKKYSKKRSKKLIYSKKCSKKWIYSKKYSKK